jgi:hypothetical protein
LESGLNEAECIDDRAGGIIEGNSLITAPDVLHLMSDIRLREKEKKIPDMFLHLFRVQLRQLASGLAVGDNILFWEK